MYRGRIALPPEDEKVPPAVRERAVTMVQAQRGGPTYGYRRARVNTGAMGVSAKRIYSVTAGNALLLPRAPRRGKSSRHHDGKLWLDRSDTLRRTAATARCLPLTSSTSTSCTRPRH